MTKTLRADVVLMDIRPKATRSLIAQFTSQPASGSLETVPGMDLLTPRKREVVVLVAKGMSNDEIDSHFFVSMLTAKTHMNRAVIKVGVRDRAQLVVFTFLAGLAKLE